MVVSGATGPRCDGSDLGLLLFPEAAEAHHSEKIGACAANQADHARPKLRY
jgi:hypothetical protein